MSHTVIKRPLLTLTQFKWIVIYLNPMETYNGRFQSENNHKWTIISICTFILKCHVSLIILIKTREMYMD
jgi:hypothetical protein